MKKRRDGRFSRNFHGFPEQIISRATVKNLSFLIFFFKTFQSFIFLVLLIFPNFVNFGQFGENQFNTCKEIYEFINEFC